MKLPSVSEIRKALINAVGLLTSLLMLGLLPEPYAGWLSSAVAVLTVITHYLVPNAAPKAPAPTIGVPGEHAA